MLIHVARLEKAGEEREDSPCCGGSLANIKLDRRKVTSIAKDAFDGLTLSNPDFLATSCPLCKKTFSRVERINGPVVMDIAEIVAMALVKQNGHHEYQEVMSEELSMIS
ncbi:MAG: hypothetical protein R2727_10190 [Bacteroidales bacterium]